MKTLIRGRVLRRLIRVYTICRSPFYGRIGINVLNVRIKWTFSIFYNNLSKIQFVTMSYSLKLGKPSGPDGINHRVLNNFRPSFLILSVNCSIHPYPIALFLNPLGRLMLHPFINKMTHLNLRTTGLYLF